MNTPHNPRHYNRYTIEPWDFIHRNGIGYIEGNIIKYVTRWREKGGVEDLVKARAYLNKLIDEEGAVRQKQDDNPLNDGQWDWVIALAIAVILVVGLLLIKGT